MQPRTKLKLATILLAATGLATWMNHEDSPPENNQHGASSNPVSFSPLSIVSQRNIGGQEPEPQTGLSNILNSASSTERQKEYKSDNECIGNMFYKRYQDPTQTPDEKFSNLRWAIEAFPGSNMSDTFDKAAVGLGIPKAKLIAELRNAATNVFQGTQTSGYKTDIDWLNYWNTLKIAHRYTGLTDMGEFNPALSKAAVSYDEDYLIIKRDKYVVNSAKDIFQNIKGQFSHIKDDQTAPAQNFAARREQLDEVLEKLSPDQRKRLREQIDIIIYATDTVLAQDSQSYLKIGMDENTYDLLGMIKRSYTLGQRINADLATQCKSETYTPK